MPTNTQRVAYYLGIEPDELEVHALVNIHPLVFRVIAPPADDMDETLIDFCSPEPDEELPPSFRFTRCFVHEGQVIYARTINCSDDDEWSHRADLENYTDDYIGDFEEADD